MEKMKNKFNDPTIKNDMKKFGDNIANKSKEISEKSMHMAKKGYESVKKVINSEKLIIFK